MGIKVGERAEKTVQFELNKHAFFNKGQLKVGKFERKIGNFFGAGIKFM